MKPKTLTILTIILALLIALWGLNELKLLPSNSEWDKALSLKKDSIQTIKIQKGDTSVELKKNGTNWQLEGKAVDVSKVTSLLNVLYPTTSPNIISQTESRHDSLNLTNEKATIISLNDSKKVLVGTYAYPGSYVRLDGNNNIFLLNNLDTTTISTEKKDWLDTKITAVLPTNVTNIETSFNKKTRIFKKDGSDWKEGEDKKDTAKINSLLAFFESLNATSVLLEDEANKYKRENEETIKFVWNGGEEKLTFIKGENDYLVIRERDQMFYSIATDFFESMKKAIDEI